MLESNLIIFKSENDYDKVICKMAANSFHVFNNKSNCEVQFFRLSW